METQFILIFGGFTLMLVWHFLKLRRDYDRLSSTGQYVVRRLQECLAIGGTITLLEHWGIAFTWQLYLIFVIVEISLILSAIRTYEEGVAGTAERIDASSQTI